ncbi:hypothetical protein T4D_14139, partial [Trichinella pseudospiralis]
LYRCEIVIEQRIRLSVSGRAERKFKVLKNASCRSVC